MMFQLEQDPNDLPQPPASQASIGASDNDGGVEAQMQADPKKQGKEKKPDENLVSDVFPER